MLKQGDAKHGRFFVPEKDLYVGRSLETYGEWCEREVQLFGQIVKPGATVVEVGANFGSHTVPLARLVGPEGRVFAIEMQPFVSQVLSANLIANGMYHAQVVQAGVSDVAQELRVPRIKYGAAYNYGGISVEFLEDFAHSKETQTVQIGPLDDLLTLTRLDFLKLDVENLELEALRGAAGLIGLHRPVIYLENDNPDATDAVLGFLRGQGYRCYWHRSWLFNANNHAGAAENVFGNERCINMLAVPDDRPVTRLRPAVDGANHPSLIW